MYRTASIQTKISSLCKDKALKTEDSDNQHLV